LLSGPGCSSEGRINIKRFIFDMDETKVMQNLRQDIVVPMRTSEHGAPLFAFHPLSGMGFCYSPLADRLGNTFSFYCVQAIGTDGERQPLDCIEAMAVCYAAEIRQLIVKRERPLSLLGWSFGGVVALQTAMCLAKEGFNIATVFLLDSHAVFRTPNHRTPGDAEVVWLFAWHLSKLAGLELDLTPERFLGKRLNEQAVLIESRLRPVIEMSDFGSIRDLLRVFKANFQALHRYSLKPYEGRVVYFKAGLSSSIATLQSQPLFDYVSDLETHEIAADHFQLLNEPYVGQIAARIQPPLE